MSILSTNTEVYQLQQQYFKTGVTRSASFRKEQLKNLDQLLRSNEKRIEAALHADLRKHPQEVFMTELGPVYEEIRVQKKHFQEWIRPKPVPTPLHLQPSRSRLYPEPVGIVLIISPWNYPILLTYRALAGAIAAGNTIMLKHSEYAVHTSSLMEELISQAFPKEYIYAIPGVGSEVLPPLFDTCRYGKVFFTGSTIVGSRIMEMCAKQLSPVSLELGGKSPCIIDSSANLSLAARRIVWGKMLNSGQSCVAPDYLLVETSVKDRLVKLMIGEIERQYGKDIRRNPDYGRIIHKDRYRRLLSYLEEGRILYGGETDDVERFIGPTIMEAISPGAALLKEEIFGPILPVFTYNTNEEALSKIEENPHPLSVYLFSNRKSMHEYFINRLSFGGGCINETIFQLGNHHIPFNGIGTSGMGRHLGKYSFELFSHYKGIIQKHNWPDPSIRFAPYSWLKHRIWRLLVGRP